MRPFACVLTVVHAGSANARIVLVRQFRYAVGTWQLESPAGGIEDGEPAPQAAMRELKEECGLLVDELVSLGYTYPSGGSTSEVAHLFAARCKSEAVTHELDKGEQIEPVLVSRLQMEKLLSGDGSGFAHAPTAVAWLRLQARGILDAWMPRR
ncbi:MAG: NUDIX hydrolase [Coriobacteriales bacterium]|nr:NUDIX hydrolase [Coriobacteriales bacterium]